MNYLIGEVKHAILRVGHTGTINAMKFIRRRKHPAMGIRKDLQYELKLQDGKLMIKSVETGNGILRHII